MKSRHQAQDYVAREQADRYDILTEGGREWQRTSPKRVWSFSQTKWIASARFATAAAAFAVIGAGETAWACIHADDFDDDLDYLVAKAQNYQVHKASGNLVEMEFAMQDLLQALHAYLKNFTDHPAVDFAIMYATVDRHFGEPFDP